jgi:hypothetical protein
MSAESVRQLEVDYPARFRQMLARSVTVAHVALGTATPEQLDLDIAGVLILVAHFLSLRDFPT